MDSGLITCGLYRLAGIQKAQEMRFTHQNFSQERGYDGQRQENKVGCRRESYFSFGGRPLCGVFYSEPDYRICFGLSRLYSSDTGKRMSLLKEASYKWSLSILRGFFIVEYLPAGIH